MMKVVVSVFSSKFSKDITMILLLKRSGWMICQIILTTDGVMTRIRQFQPKKTSSSLNNSILVPSLEFTHSIYSKISLRSMAITSSKMIEMMIVFGLKLIPKFITMTGSKVTIILIYLQVSSNVWSLNMSNLVHWFKSKVIQSKKLFLSWTPSSEWDTTTCICLWTFTKRKVIS